MHGGDGRQDKEASKALPCGNPLHPTGLSVRGNTCPARLTEGAAPPQVLCEVCVELNVEKGLPHCSHRADPMCLPEFLSPLVNCFRC